MLCAMVGVVLFAGGARMHASRSDARSAVLVQRDFPRNSPLTSTTHPLHTTLHHPHSKLDSFTHPIGTSLHNL